MDSNPCHLQYCPLQGGTHPHSFLTKRWLRELPRENPGFATPLPGGDGALCAGEQHRRPAAFLSDRFV